MANIIWYNVKDLYNGYKYALINAILNGMKHELIWLLLRQSWNYEPIKMARNKINWLEIRKGP